MFRISLHYTLQSHGKWSEEYRAFLDEAALADGLGLSGIYVGEHHFSEDGWCPSPFVALGAAAAVTRRLRLVTDIVVLPLHNPFEVAEHVAVLDALSGGRAVLGVGLGYRREEYDAFGASYRRRAEDYDSKLSAVRALLEGKSVRAGGMDLVTYPRPVQRPRPLIWVAAKSELAVRRAAGRGDAWIMDPVTDISVLERRVRAYREEMGRLGKEVRDLPLRREVFVSRSEADLRRAEELMLRSYYEDYYRWGHLQDSEGREVDPREVPFEEIRDQVLSRFLVGTPAQVIEAVDEYRRRLGITELVAKMSFPGITHDMRSSAIELLAREVLPGLED
ncbi:MAG: LLM class flavin-dependent oxidoreductase [Conexivisphaerales archaeon]|jgi:alkanesulfonate monooxygenase SsuD/methylene tetrahydromethanopterin reductase-like flavin-dependent oxidoreductase (luciferase family)|nr:LLM class flavin-dependent oxidoreductase [Conexivisphaerales archaeon]